MNKKQRDQIQFSGIYFPQQPTLCVHLPLSLLHLVRNLDVVFQDHLGGGFSDVSFSFFYKMLCFFYISAKSFSLFFQRVAKDGMTYSTWIISFLKILKICSKTPYVTFMQSSSYSTWWFLQTETNTFMFLFWLDSAITKIKEYYCEKPIRLRRTRGDVKNLTESMMSMRVWTSNSTWYGDRWWGWCANDCK